MVLTGRQAQLLINKLNNLNINQQVHMAAPINYVLRTFEGNINTGYPTGLKIYPQATKYIDKESDKLDISVSNSNDIIYHFISLAEKYLWGCLAFMVNNDEVTKSIHLAE